MSPERPTLLPLGDDAVLVRFATRLDDKANAHAVMLARHLQATPPAGATEIVPNLVSVLVRYDPAAIGYDAITADIRLCLSLAESDPDPISVASHSLSVTYGGEDGPDLEPLAAEMGVTPADFIAAHAQARLRVLATGFAPGFVYCGFHENLPAVPRREAVRPRVPAGTILFAAGQTAVTATPIPTGWHVIGRTDFRNFDPASSPPTKLAAGDHVTFPEARS